jgi:hypothetical protein
MTTNLSNGDPRFPWRPSNKKGLVGFFPPPYMASPPLFRCHDVDDYEGLIMVWERAGDMEEDNLQFMDWFLGLETDGSVDGLPVFV